MYSVRNQQVIYIFRREKNVCSLRKFRQSLYSNKFSEYNLKLNVNLGKLLGWKICILNEPIQYEFDFPAKSSLSSSQKFRWNSRTIANLISEGKF